MSQRAWLVAVVLFVIFLTNLSSSPSSAQGTLTLSVEPATIKAGENLRIEVRGQPASPLIVAASTANSGLGQFGGQEVLLGADAFVLFTVQTDAEGSFSTTIAMPPGVNGAFFFQAALGLTTDFSSVVLSNSAQLSIAGLPAEPDTAFIPEDDDDGDGIPNFAEGNGDADGDGVPNFLDPDADGDGVADSEQASSDAVSFLDTDGDEITDFLDRDDDGDGIPDTEDSDPQTALAPTDFTSDERLAILSIETEVTGQSPVPVTRAGRIVDLLVQHTGQGGGASRVLFPSDAPDGRKLLISPNAVVDDSASGEGVQRLTVTVTVPVTDPDVAVIVAVPLLPAVTKPAFDTVATLLSELLHVTVPREAPAGSGLAVSC